MKRARIRNYSLTEKLNLQADDRLVNAFENILMVLRDKIRRQIWATGRFAALAVLALIIALISVSAQVPPTSSPPSLDLSRPVRPLEFLSAVGTRAALFGNESGDFEAWAYPLKILRDFHLRFHTDGRIIPAESLARTVSVRPESSTILYASDTFQVRETFFVPVTEPGAIVKIEVETTDPLEIEVVFQRDFQLEWPAALGGTYLHWDPVLHAFVLGEELKKYSALVGSPSGVMSETEYSTNYSMSSENAFLLGPSGKGKDTKLVVIAGSLDGQSDAENVYRKLSNEPERLLQSSADYYRQYLNRTVNLVLPDKQLQQAYDWSRISVIQGMVHDPLLGTGLIAGYRSSGTSQRPGFAWFFGRDALWTSFALNAEGDFASTRTALEFLTGFQRTDGKIPHEIAQSASLVDWFKNYPYGFASADATPLYIIAMNDYVVHSGDIEFASSKWDNLFRAYQFLKSTYNADGLPRNFGFGHGWVEGGPLLPVETELYQSSLGVEALHALSNLAHLVGKQDAGRQFDQEYARQKDLVNDKFWSEEKKTFSFALDANQHQVEIPSVLATVPLWFDLLEDSRVQPTIDKLADSDHQTDWGMRIISSQSPLYNPGGYHFGSVWPLFTGWASVGEYRYHRPLPAYSNLRSNALLALGGSLGHVTEVLSGDYYEPLSTSSPQQIWSAAMVVSPILKGMFGLEVDAIGHRLRLSPHIPADWKSFEIGNVHVGNVVLDLKYRRDAENVSLEVTRSGSGQCAVEFSPAFSPRAEISSTTINGRAVRSQSQVNKEDQHLATEFPVTSENTILRMNVRNDFGVRYSITLPPQGESSQALKIVSEAWAPGYNELTLEVAGIAGKQYDLFVLNPGLISSIDGAELVKNETSTSLEVKLPGDNSASYVHGKVSIHLSATAARKVSRVQ
ncbi:MAG TPA: amylo-alpha-1,6-glucosidase [Terriglobales bacterium]|nr:amylo-alpha-1,6-glucosidase [Terriglobales bacterium]